MSGMDWTLNAACRLNVDWTPEKEPSDGLRLAMASVCSGCTVRRPCASQALNEAAESGMYAGVWLPNAKCGSRRSVKWQDARRHLKAIAEGAA